MGTVPEGGAGFHSGFPPSSVGRAAQAVPEGFPDAPGWLPGLQRRSILVVENDPVIRRLLEKRLADFMPKPFTPSQALQLIRRHLLP